MGEIEMLRAGNIHLRPVETTDLGLLVAWRNEPANWKAFFNKFPLSLAGQQAWFAELVANPVKRLFVICLNSDDSPIGTIGLDDIDFANQRGEYGNVLIGESRQTGKGLATEASRLLLDYAFSQLNMNRIYLYVAKHNQRAIGLYEKIGFVSEGILREHFFSGGTFNDVLLMACLRREWKEAGSARATDGVIAS